MIHLEGNNGPVSEERDEVAVAIHGQVPSHLRGVYYRNGPNPRSGWSAHMLDGDGMVHGVELPSGRYRNRFVRTPLYLDASTPRDGHVVSTANTHVIQHGRGLLALEEGGAPYELTTVLDTVGPYTFGGSLEGAFTAHPKRCPISGDLFGFGYSIRPPHLTLHRWSGRRLTSRPVDLDRCSMMHDFAVTATRVVIFDSPFVFDGSPWTWDPSHVARIGVVGRDGGDVVWTEVAPGHLSHAANAYDDGEDVVLVGTRLAGPTDLPRLHRWRLRPGGRVEEGPLDDVSAEYPRFDERRLGLPNRVSFTTSFFFTAEPDHGEINRHDDDRRTTLRLPQGWTCGEPAFVPSPGSTSEGDGHLLTLAHDRGLDRSSLLIVDAGALDVVAEVVLPVRVPGGFHGSWVADAVL